MDQGNITFTDEHGVLHYVSKRYTSPRQRRVDAREQHCLSRLLDRHIQPGSRSKVVDVPCGYGRIMPLLQQLGFAYSWADVSSSMVAYVSQLDDAAGQGGGWTASVDALPFDDDSFDLTTTIRLFHHFHDPAERIAALRELRRVSREWVLVSFYTPFNLHRWTKRMFCAIQGRRQRIAFMPRRQFVDEASEAGLDVVEMRAWAPLLHAHTFALMRISG